MPAPNFHTAAELCGLDAVFIHYLARAHTLLIIEILFSTCRIYGALIDPV